MQEFKVHEWNLSLGMAAARFLSFLMAATCHRVAEREVNPGETTRERSVL